MTIYEQISVRIIKEQELIIGPIAWQEAVKVPGIKIIDQEKQEVSISDDPKTVLSRLVEQYSRLFGKVSTEVCKEAAQDLLVELPKDQIPANLQ